MSARRLIDVRQPGEYAGGHIAGSELVPLKTLVSHCEAWDHAAPIELICKSGMRAGIARDELKRRGFTDLTVLNGGVDAWRSAGKPLTILKAAKGPQGASSRPRLRVLEWIRSHFSLLQ